ncbi:hypothetical protein [Streptomyces sp. NPDC089795]|uniref:hypothetical protein n=1 Tax=Streptomyces sp. NPDC089795 TaxID=3155297 RepID=UPI00342AB578
MTTESVEVRRGVPEGAAARVAELYGPPEAGRRFIAGHLHADRAVTALSGGEGGEGGELVMDGIAVEQRCRRIRLDLVAENPRAREPYERHGFRAVRVRRTPWLRDVLGFGGVTTMHQEVAAR